MTTTNTITYIGGPLDGWTLLARIGHRWSNYRDDAGEPLAVNRGSREFGIRTRRPTSRWYILQSGYHCYVHGSLWSTWKAADGDVRREAVQHYQRAPVVVAPQQPDRRPGAVPAGRPIRPRTAEAEHPAGAER